jgi:hypothetical protein
LHPVPAHMRARGEPSPAASLHVCRRVRLTAHYLQAQIPVQMCAGVGPVLAQLWAGASAVPAQTWAGPPPGSGRGGAPAAARRCSSAGRGSGPRPARGSLAALQRCASRVAALQRCNAATKPHAAAEAHASACIRYSGAFLEEHAVVPAEYLAGQHARAGGAVTPASRARGGRACRRRTRRTRSTRAAR